MSPPSDCSEPRPPRALPTRLIADIPLGADKPQWLVESLWAASGVGIIGGLPKSRQPWLAAARAVAVASGTPALGRFAVSSPGAVLVFVAEGGSRALRARFDSVAKARAVSLADLPVRELDVPALYLDEPEHWADLRQTIEELRPRLLLLDPFVRIIARVDENSAQEVSRVLGSLRALQREFDLAVLLVHHMRKSPSPRLGQRLRGSGDFAAWYDSGLYLVKHGDDDLLLYAEHRDAPAPPPLRVRLQEGGGGPHLVAEELESRAPSTASTTVSDPLEAQLLHKLGLARRPHPTAELRSALRVRNARLLQALRLLQHRGLVSRTAAGWALPGPKAPSPIAAFSQQQALPFLERPTATGD